MQGVLRVYSPVRGDFSHDQLLLETRPDEREGAIYQLLLDKFTKINEWNLAVLYL